MVERGHLRNGVGIAAGEIGRKLGLGHGLSPLGVLVAREMAPVKPAARIERVVQLDVLVDAVIPIPLVDSGTFLVERGVAKLSVHVDRADNRDASHRMVQGAEVVVLERVGAGTVDQTREFLAQLRFWARASGYGPP